MSGLLPFPPQTSLEVLQAIFLLFAGHALMDYPLQGEFLSTSKNRHFLSKLQDPSRPPSIWLWCMTSHAMLHAVVVWAITGCFIVGMIEFALHWIIDFAKCENWTTFHQDQALHLICKIAYVIGAMLW